MSFLIRMTIRFRNTERFGSKSSRFRIYRFGWQSSTDTHRNTRGPLKVEIRNAPVLSDLHKEIMHLLRSPSVGNDDPDLCKRHVGDQIFQREVLSAPNRRDIGRRFITDMSRNRRFFVQTITQRDVVGISRYFLILSCSKGIVTHIRRHRRSSNRKINVRHIIPFSDYLSIWTSAVRTKLCREAVPTYHIFLAVKNIAFRQVDGVFCNSIIYRHGFEIEPNCIVTESNKEGFRVQ